MTDLAANLLDVNFLVALAWPNHIAHSRAVSWFLENRDIPFATCPLTEAGFVRISMNPLIVTEHISAGAALSMLEKYRSGYKHVFWPDSLAIGEALAPFGRVSGHRQITDCYLLALAAARGGYLVSFDGGIAEIAPPKYRGSLVLVEF